MDTAADDRVKEKTGIATSALLSSRRPVVAIPLRLAYLAAGIGVFVIAYYLGATAQLAPEEAEGIRNEMVEKVQGIGNEGIFANNIAPALAMFVPGFGVGLGAYSAYSTGLVVSAFAQVMPELAATSPLAVLASPYGLLELFAYGLAISRSGLLVAQLLKARSEWKRFTLIALIEVAIVVVALLVGSAIEGEAIDAMQQG